mmetsp:Transcript_18461/g.51795  ORF Transcript_18461/g.51795 Transcript_18461/m.51795 type:complete len:151 (+) Transcript_18461:147-599(+)|eukprot:CAMPEP_0202342040 /NCGR_PEP_ID=MMETSP1126-20121109/2771_1 /ASSEMBLY_ACC=CAM_ASM_000457 /TAXON_ID=3047 /ORGANISM="Dunaliella tertiolecta, Strain CCMP1320" /LENGTH=150 /DNA_ID=CAMNT_0048932931 /DNA_START=97 /DNA_END=549 /DNA_ORIENTATION=+
MEEFRPTGVKDVSANDFIATYAAHLKSNDKLQLPTWVDVVKTAHAKELPPMDEDWYFVRAAAICRRLYSRPDIGIGRFTTLFGTKLRRGQRKERQSKAAAGLIRHICKALEEVGILEKSASVKGGRKLTASGQRDMDLIAGRCTVNLPQF